MGVLGPVFSFFFWGGFIAFVIYVASRQQARARQERERAAVHFRLQFRRNRIEGAIDGHPVEVRFVDGKNSYTEFKIGGLPKELELHAKGLLDRFFGVVETGDADFDERIAVRGPHASVFATLDRDARTALRLGLGEAKAKLENGELRARLGGMSTARPIVEEVDRLLTICRTLVHEEPIVDRLVAVARTDSKAAVRSHALAALVEAAPEAPATRRTCLAAVMDPDPGVVICAAKALHRDGVDALSALALDESPPVERRVEALDALVHVTTHAERGALVPKLVRSLRAKVRARGFEWAAALRMAEMVPEAQRHVRAAGGDADEDAAIAALLGTSPDPKSEEALLVLLGRESAEVRIAAARALGECGSAAAVAPLHAAGNSLLERAVSHACEQAAARIKERIEGASEGQLTIAEPDAEAGELSVADAAPGAVSLARRAQKT